MIPVRKGNPEKEEPRYVLVEDLEGKTDEPENVRDLWEELKKKEATEKRAGQRSRIKDEAR